VVTGVGLDHIAILGNTLEEIAREKAAIIKPGGVAVLGAGTHEVASVFGQRIAETGAMLHSLPETLPASVLEGFPAYQAENIACAVAAAEAALGHPVSGPMLGPVLAATPLPGRFEVLREDPLLIIDAAHNPSAAAKLAEALRGHYGQKVPADLLIGILADKDAIGILDALLPLFDHIAVTQSASARALPAEELAECVKSRSSVKVACYGSVGQALAELTTANTPVIATGSATIAGEVRRLAVQGRAVLVE